MNNNIQIIKKWKCDNQIFNFVHRIKHFKQFFDSRLYNNLILIIKQIIATRNSRQADIWLSNGLTLRKVQYFFWGSKWYYDKLNNLRLLLLRKVQCYKDTEKDILIFDWSVFNKNKNSSFRGLADFFYSNTLKKATNWFYLMWASIINEKGLKYILDFKFYYKRMWNKMKCWKKFFINMIKKTKAKLVILDREFSKDDFCTYLYKKAKKDFLVRFSDKRAIWVPWKFLAKKKSRRKHMLNHLRYNIWEVMKDFTYFQVKTTHMSGKLWILTDVLVNSWKKHWHMPVTLIIFQADRQNTPLVLVTSKKINNTTDLQEYLYEAIKMVFFYYKRWSIEDLFKETKFRFNIDKFKVLSETSIYKYMHIILFAYTIVQIFIEFIPYRLKISIMDFLYKTRNIKKDWLSVIRVKLFFESVNRLFYLSVRDIYCLLKEQKWLTA